jgi:hypothetical protein
MPLFAESKEASEPYSDPLGSHHRHDLVHIRVVPHRAQRNPERHGDISVSALKALRCQARGAVRT